MGKDNIVFHSVIWPSELMGYGDGGELGAGRGDLQLPHDIVSSEFLTMEGRQFSTSRDVVIYVGEVLDRYSADALRYYLTAAGPETQDTDFTWAEFVRRNNDELARELGQPRQPRADERVPDLRRGPRARARSPTTTGGARGRRGRLRPDRTSHRAGPAQGGAR